MRLVIPGGSAEIVAKQALVVQFVREAFSHYRPIAAIGDGAVLTGAAPLKSPGGRGGVSPEGRACRKGAYGVAPPFSGGRLAPPRSVLT